MLSGLATTVRLKRRSLAMGAGPTALDGANGVIPLAPPPPSPTTTPHPPPGRVQRPLVRVGQQLAAPVGAARWMALFPSCRPRARTRTCWRP
jgi:hypothetical protein